MAGPYTVATSKHFSLSAATVETVTLSADHGEVEVAIRANAALVYFTVGSADSPPADPTVAGNDTYFVASAAGASLKKPLGNTRGVVKLISAGTPDVSVTGI